MAFSDGMDAGATPEQWAESLDRHVEVNEKAEAAAQLKLKFEVKR